MSDAKVTNGGIKTAYALLVWESREGMRFALDAARTPKTRNQIASDLERILKAIKKPSSI